MREFVINGATMTSKEAVFKQLNRLFAFPAYFGNNLDALWDVLTEGKEPTVIHFKHTDALLAQMASYGEQLLKVFQNIEAVNSCYTIHFYPGEMDKKSRMME